MTGSTKAQITQVEDLLHSFHTMHANDNVAPAAARRFDGRPLIAACLVFFVFAPGCAAAAVFLLRNDNAVPPLMAPDNNPPHVSKSDRLPLEQRSSEAVDTVPLNHDMRIAAAILSEDPKFLEPMLIRGSLEDGTITRLIDAPANDPTAIALPILEEPVAAPTKPRAKRQARRATPVHVAEAPPIPELPEPNFFEKLFGTRFN